MDALIRAAGGVVYRAGTAGTEIAVVHRPRFDDWSLPKGKLHRGEHVLIAARREVHEETGIWPVLTGRLPSVSYEVEVHGERVPKTVQFFAMRVAHDDGFTAGSETDALAWLPVDQARDRLSYERDLLVVQAFADRPSQRAPVLLVRHATAGAKRAWAGPDILRPLDPDGKARAGVLADLLIGFAPRRLISAAPLRCVDTLVPLGHAVRRPVEVDRVFDEDADTDAAVAQLRASASTDTSQATVICSQGKLIPRLLAALSGGGAATYRTDKGAGWLLALDVDGALVALDPLD